MEPQMAGTSMGDMGEEKHHSKLSWPIALVVLIIVVLGWWFVAQRGAQIVEQGQEVTEEEIGPGQILSRPVTPGEIIANFPREFLVEPGVQVLESYEIKYAGSETEFPTVRYTSALSLAENVALFEDVLTTGGWEITQEADANAEGVTFFYGKRGSEEVNITFVSKGGVVEVSIAYLLTVEVIE